MIVDAIQAAFSRAHKKNWWKLYVAVDVHGVIFYSTHDKSVQRKFMPGAKEALLYLSRRKDITLFLWSCSHPEEVEELKVFFKKHGINFTYYGENPEVTNGALGFYEKKPYYNILLDDKAGFNHEEWPLVLEEFKKHPGMENNEK